jgi:hypothetical protein
LEHPTGATIQEEEETATTKERSLHSWYLNFSNHFFSAPHFVPSLVQSNQKPKKMKGILRSIMKSLAIVKKKKGTEKEGEKKRNQDHFFRRLCCRTDPTSHDILPHSVPVGLLLRRKQECLVILEATTTMGTTATRCPA